MFWSGLYLCETAIDEQLGPCDRTRIIGGEKHDSSCDLIRGPESAERNDVRDHLQTLLVPSLRTRVAFMRMRRLRRSVAHVRANERTAALVAL